MEKADRALVYFSPKVVEHKKLAPITKEDVAMAFGGNVEVCNSTEEVLNFVKKHAKENTTLLMMSSGNFDGINYQDFGTELITKI